jgi:Holliday junction DNA helicase RuvA
MISYVRGVVAAITGGAAIVECGGIGYEVVVSPATAANMPSVGREVKLYTHMQLRDDGVSLFGFLTTEEMRMFNLLLGVTGIGPRAAVNILAALTPERLALAIVSNDAAALCSAPGIGKKTAQRMILELKDKLNAADAVDYSGEPATAQSSGVRQDAADALTALGYGRSDALKAVMETAEEGMSAEAIIKAALRRLSRG